MGIDIGGSGIKAALVDTRTGELLSERVRVATPQAAAPEAMIRETRDLIADLPPDLPAGIGFPGPLVGGRIMTATHINDAWIGVDGVAAFGAGLGRRCTVLNDADAAGLAEMRFGAGRGVGGVVAIFTLGTGIGSAIFLDGQLVPNTELGHVELDGADAELAAAASARKRDGLSWDAWADRLERYLAHMDGLLWPDLIILGGGVSRRADRFLAQLDVRPPVVAAQLENQAGIVGAAVRAIETG